MSKAYLASPRRRQALPAIPAHLTGINWQIACMSPDTQENWRCYYHRHGYQIQDPVTPGKLWIPPEQRLQAAE